jgi:hypothetical protein
MQAPPTCVGALNVTCPCVGRVMNGVPCGPSGLTFVKHIKNDVPESIVMCSSMIPDSCGSFSTRCPCMLQTQDLCVAEAMHARVCMLQART